ncbi:hypothetical protein [Pseudonocardia sp. ICBG601]|nr:hypothetical protein [Pseudonocardia sp. ICBG601]
MIGVVTLLFLPETARRPLRDGQPSASSPEEAREIARELAAR